MGESKKRAAEIWGSAPWERVEYLLAPVHAHIIRALAAGPGVRWLDLATGTGAVALLAARAGADVTGLDLAPRLIETARQLARRDGLRVRFDVGDAEALPYGENSFDAISSAMGIVFAPDHHAVARELARVCRPGGSIAFSAWREGGGWTPVTRRYVQPPGPGEPDLLDWAREEYAESLLGGAFELRLEQGDAPVTGSGGQEVWQLVLAASGPFKARVEALDPKQRRRLRREFVDYLDQHRRGGRVHLSAPYVLIIGKRRD